MSVFLCIGVLLLDTDLAVFIELHFEHNVVRLFNLKVVALAQGMYHSLLVVFVSHSPALFLSDGDHAHSILGKHQEVVGGQ